MNFIVFYLELIISLEGPGMFFSSAAIIRRLRKYTATTTDSRQGMVTTDNFCITVDHRWISWNFNPGS